MLVVPIHSGGDAFVAQPRVRKLEGVAFPKVIAFWDLRTAMHLRTAMFLSFSRQSHASAFRTAMYILNAGNSRSQPDDMQQVVGGNQQGHTDNTHLSPSSKLKAGAFLGFWMNRKIGLMPSFCCGGHQRGTAFLSTS